MEMSPELEKSIKTTLSLFMDEPEAERFMDLDYATSLVKQRQLQQPPWQPLVSLGVHAAELYAHQDTNVEKTILQELVSQALEPVDTLFQSILPKPSEKLLECEQARLLFHTRFALGFLLLAKGDKARSKAILHDMASTRISVRGKTYYSEDIGILSCTNDIRQGKLEAAFGLLPEYGEQKNFDDILYLMTEAVACAPWATYILHIVPFLIDGCVAEYEKADYDGPGLEWLWLFVEVGELLSLYEEYDSSGSVPNECKVESAQYMAWSIGQIAGRFAARWHDDPFGQFQDFESAIGEKEYQSERGEEKTHEALMATLALLREYHPNRDWQKMRDECLSIWRLSYSYSGMPLSEIGPCDDLYWAMRIGFADKFLKPEEAKTPAVHTKLVDTWSPRVRSDIQEILEKKYLLPPRLTKEEVGKLIESEEGMELEFKESARWDCEHERVNNDLAMAVVHTVAAFLNTRGGKLVLGVRDKPHKVVGVANDYKTLRKKDSDGYKLFLCDVVCDNIHNGKILHSEYVTADFCDYEGNDVHVLSVQRALQPAWVREGGGENLYIRVDNSTKKLTAREATDYVSKHFKHGDLSG